MLSLSAGKDALIMVGFSMLGSMGAVTMTRRQVRGMLLGRWMVSIWVTKSTIPVWSGVAGRPVNTVGNGHSCRLVLMVRQLQWYMVTSCMLFMFVGSDPGRAD